MGNPAREPAEHFTYRHYLTWPDEERWELIDGIAWAMSPAPLTVHQELLTRLFGRLSACLSGKPCRLFVAPFDVLLPSSGEADEEVDTVVQPDLLVYCDAAKITRRGGRGAPDFIIEILSPRSAKKDFGEKFELYEKRGVREYWIVDPAAKAIHAWALGPDGSYGEERIVEEAESLGSVALAGFEVDAGGLFRELER